MPGVWAVDRVSDRQGDKLQRDPERGVGLLGATPYVDGVQVDVEGVVLDMALKVEVRVDRGVAVAEQGLDGRAKSGHVLVGDVC